MASLGIHHFDGVPDKTPAKARSVRGASVGVGQIDFVPGCQAIPQV